MSPIRVAKGGMSYSTLAHSRTVVSFARNSRTVISRSNSAIIAPYFLFLSLSSGNSPPLLSPEAKFTRIPGKPRGQLNTRTLIETCSAVRRIRRGRSLSSFKCTYNCTILIIVDEIEGSATDLSPTGQIPPGARWTFPSSDFNHRLGVHFSLPPPNSCERFGRVSRSSNRFCGRECACVRHTHTVFSLKSDTLWAREVKIPAHEIFHHDRTSADARARADIHRCCDVCANSFR